MEQDLKWAIGIAVTVVMAFAGIVVTTFRVLAERISGNVKDLHARVDGVKDTHARVDDVRDLHTKIDDVKQRYVRRDDLDGHLGRLEKSIQDTRDQMDKNHAQVISLLTKPGSDR